MNRPEAEQIASAITMIRPDWLRTSLLTILSRHQNRSARDTMLALVWVAYDPDTKFPTRIDSEGPWWHTGRLAAVETAITPPARLACPIHGQPEPCSACGPLADPDAVRRHLADARAAIRAARTISATEA